MNRIVMIVLVDADRYGRLVGRIYVGTTDVSAQLVAEGAAWFNSEYAHDQTLYLLEGEARDAKRGLWALPLDERIEPWEFRKRQSCRREPLRVGKGFAEKDAFASGEPVGE
jgi:endonuclease YncB( thermonuclease family)